MYTITMKVLIVPAILQPEYDTAWFLTQNMADLSLTRKGWKIGVCSSQAGSIKNAVCYPAPKPSSFHLNRVFSASTRTYEQAMYSGGLSDAAYLKNDLQCIEQAIESFHPDIVFTINRTAAVLACRSHNIPCWGYVHPGMLRGRRAPVKCLEDLNQLLRDNQYEQIFRIFELYEKIDHRISFGFEWPASLSASQIDTIGCMSIFPLQKAKTAKLCIFLSHSPLRKSELKKLLCSSFKGAPYQVYAWYPGCQTQTIDNMHFMADLRISVLPGSIACIHDGEDYVFNQCLNSGLPQFVLNGPHCMRAYNAFSVQHMKNGLMMSEEDLSMQSLYETFRKITADDSYDIYAMQYASYLRTRKDLSYLADIMEISVSLKTL